VEIARLRQAVRGLAELSATPDGFRLAPLRATEIVVLARLVDDEHAALLALLEDGQAWSSSALAVALGASQRSVQRALLGLESAGKVRAIGRARAKRWLNAPSAEFATPLLLPPTLESA
jgi:ParB-like chromosome segregation protein Spo0J